MRRQYLAHSSPFRSAERWDIERAGNVSAVAKRFCQVEDVSHREGEEEGNEEILTTELLNRRFQQSDGNSRGNRTCSCFFSHGT